MKVKIPFTGRTLYLGKDDVNAAKQALGFGAFVGIEGLSTQKSRISIDALFKLYNEVVDVKASVNRIQGATMKAGYRFVDVNDEDLSGDVAQSAIAEALLNTKKTSFEKLKRLWIRNLIVAGNNYTFLQPSLSGEVMVLVVVDPRMITVVSDKYGDVLGYIQKKNNVEVQRFKPEEIAHTILDYSTQTDILGVSQVESIATDALTEIASQDVNLAFYKNGGVPSHWLIVDEDLDDDQLKEFKKEWDKEFKGSKNKFKAGLVPHLKDIKTVGMSQKDIQYIKTREFTTRKVVVAFGVDAFILGYTEKVQRGNADVIYKMFYENTIRPYELLFEEFINNEVLPVAGLDRIKFRANLSNYDSKKEVADISRADVLAGVMTINEARKTRGLNENDNALADELLINGLPLDDLGFEANEAIKNLGTQLEKKRNQMFNLLNE